MSSRSTVLENQDRRNDAEAEAEQELEQVNEELEQNTLELQKVQLELSMETQQLNSAQEQCQSLAALVNLAMRRLLQAPGHANEAAEGAPSTPVSNANGNFDSTTGRAHSSGKPSQDWSFERHPGAQPLPFPMSAATRAFLELEDPAAPSNTGADTERAQQASLPASNGPPGITRSENENTDDMLTELDGILKSYVERKVQQSFALQED
eukprot:INCI18391.2.p1 GENE.INCI18391.2~~INCI18391.2.p1  ORF type:complete len:209 (+),score=44.02 INCI18391.2:154-780(+)